MPPRNPSKKDIPKPIAEHLTDFFRSHSLQKKSVDEITRFYDETKRMFGPRTANLTFMMLELKVPITQIIQYFNGNFNMEQNTNSGNVNAQGAQISGSNALGNDASSVAKNSTFTISQEIRSSAIADSIKDLLIEAMNQIKNASLSDEDRAEAAGYVDKIGTELTKEKPDESRLKRAMRNLNEVCTVAANVVKTIPALSDLWATITG